MVTITESGMTFGPYDEADVYLIEQSDAYRELGQAVKTVEFVYRPNEEKLFFIEAKSSSPMPKGESFDQYITEIAEKFVHSFQLWLTLYLKRRTDKINQKLLKAQMDKQIFRFILVINGHEITWLPPIKAALERKMVAEIRIWNHEVIVLNDTQAKKRGLIQASA